jgi:aminoglycoside 6'-N-acetyltransferase I
MPRPLNTHPLRPNDSPAYAALFTEVFSLPPWNESWDKGTVELQLKQRMAKTDFAGAVAQAGATPAGFATGYSLLGLPKLFYLEQLFVHPRFQGRGVGKALFSHLKDQARSLGHSRMLLLTKPGATQAFYAAQGCKLLWPWASFKGKVLLYLPLQHPASKRAS